MQDSGQQNPHLIPPQRLPAAVEPVEIGTHGQAQIRRRNGLQAGEKGRTEDYILPGRIESDVVRLPVRVGLAHGVGVPQPPEIEGELIRVVHAKETHAPIERIQVRRAQRHARRDVCEERGDEGGEGRVFEEGLVGSAWGWGFGVCDHGLEGGVELVEQVYDRVRVAFAVGDAVLT